MEKEKALNLIRQYKGNWIDEVQEAIEILIPELRESEDEKIRKSLIKFLTDIKKISESGRTTWAVRKEDAEMCKSFLAYLEKQKENPKSSDSIPPDCTSDVRCEDRSQKHNISVDEIAQDYVDGVKEYNPEPTWDLMQTAVCYGYHYCEMKEQKPDIEICSHSVKSKSYSETGRSHFVIQVLSDGHMKKAIEIYSDECDCEAGDVVKAIIRKKD